MHIAFLRPDSNDSPEGRLGAALVRALPADDVESFRIPASILGEAQVVADLFARARDFDLIHNLIGPTPLAFAGFVPTPIVTTLRREHSFEELALLRRFRGKAWYVGGEFEGPPDLECSAVIHTPGPDASPEEFETCVRAYLQVYERVVAENAKRRVDTVHDRRPWGEYWVLADTPEYKVKRIDVIPGTRLSYQRHAKRAEHWVIVRGRAVVTLDGVDHELVQGQSIDVPLGTAHRIANPGPGLLSFIEVQQGTYFGEDDIERLADDFGRTS